MTKDEALKLVACAIEEGWSFDRIDSEVYGTVQEALAQPEQEPVALPCCGYADASAIKWNPHNQVVQCHNCGQIYTTPPQRTWVVLTNNDLQPIAEEYRILFGSWVHDFARAIEAKLKQKNGYAEENT